MPDRKTDRRPKRLAISDLDQIALDYLARFATSRKRVEDMLTRRIRKSAHFHGDDPAPLLAAIPGVIAKLERNRFLDDEAFAGMKAASLTRRGTSKRQIGAKLAQLGIASSLAYDAQIEAALDALADHCEKHLDIDALIVIARTRQSANASRA